MELFRLPAHEMPYGAKFMSNNNEVFSRINGDTCPQKGNFLLTMCDKVISIKDGVETELPIFVPNQVFVDDSGRYYLIARAETESVIAAKAAVAGCAYLIARKKDGETKAEAWMNGRQIDFPNRLTNELGVSYMYIDFKTYGDICKRVNGYMKAYKVEPIIVLKTAVGEEVKSVLNGVCEHSVILQEGRIAVQNFFHGEVYTIGKNKLQSDYEYDYTLEIGLEVWKPKHILQEWTWTDENIFGMLWGSFEFLAKAMININNPEDVYGCNYNIFNGDDVANASHCKTAIFLPKKPLSKEWLRTPAVMAGIASVEEGIPKTTYVEIPFVIDVFSAIC